MKQARFAAVILGVALAATTGLATAQGFSSISSAQHPVAGPATPEPEAPPQPGAEASPAPSVPEPARCEPANPFVIGSAALEAAKACAATNPFLTGSALDEEAAAHVSSGVGAAGPNPAATAPASATQGTPGAGEQSALVPATTPFGVPHDQAIAATLPPVEPADRVLVKKSERRLYLLRSARVIAEYPIRLGLNPYGPKQRAGDFRTPEGIYEVTRRNPHSEFFLSLEVSYPNQADIERAHSQGVEPGGLIMIHGQPNVPHKSPGFYANNDWTDGCIALSNADMVDVWLRTNVGTPIEIEP